MKQKEKSAGFTLVELLLVLGILAIISAIAIPSFMGQRRRARLIGDAQSNAQVLRMQLETYKADNGIYGGSGTVLSWTSSGTVSGSTATALNFTPKGNSKMNYNVTIGAGGQAYSLAVVDPNLGTGTVVYTTNQNGSSVVTPY